MSAVIDLSAQPAIVRRCERRKTDVRTDALRGDSNDGVCCVKNERRHDRAMWLLFIIYVLCLHYLTEVSVSSPGIRMVTEKSIGNDQPN